MKAVQYFLSISTLFLMVSAPIRSQDIKVYDSFDDFEHILKLDNDTIYVINFWATWCAPCIKELPYFEDLGNTQQSEPVKVILVSLDFKNQLESRLRPFVLKHRLSSDIVHLADPKVNNWIDKVDPNWSGSIPATYIYRGIKKKFIEKEFHSTNEISAEIKSIIKI